ncbi:LysE family translocator [Cohnella herbarum]|uniref:LysE family transporter n=1 Tax=Cohnella herbarum TaxID=2728023 RepID=A0A7Z2VRS7_9BACL|nr:LysE family transporter [Cohnella herbarum]QJD87989.1 LysE family transporter [Cohnella herbarum]
MSAIVKGLIIGVSIAAPVGPIGLLCIRKTLNQGRLFGLVSGLGAATADACYGLIAALGLTMVTNFVSDQAIALNLIGALFLFYLAYSTAKAPVTTVETVKLPGRRYWPTYATTFMLTMTNPITIVSFAGIFSGMNLSEGSSASLWLVLGVFLGSAAWWVILCLVVGLIKRTITPHALKWINYGSAMVLAIFAFISLYHFGVGIG